MTRHATAGYLDQAKLDADYTRADLRHALETASPVEAIVLLELIGRTSSLSRDIAALRDAIQADAPAATPNTTSQTAMDIMKPLLDAISRTGGAKS